jgi:catechol 2,3-dioxygenase-like lactoylglutathione lyase family enzyme
MDLGWFEVSLNVRDIARSLESYRTLGFDHVDGTVEGRNVTLQKGDCRIGLYQGHLDPDRPQLIFWQGDVAAIARDLADKGLRFERAADDRGAGAMLLDPDGHPLYFVNIQGATRKEA